MELTEKDLAEHLDKETWPWKDSTFDYIRAFDLLHLARRTPAELLNEAWRVLKPEGEIHLRVPSAEGTMAFHPKARSFWTYRTFMWFDKDTRERYKQHYPAEGIKPFHVTIGQSTPDPMGGIMLEVKLKKVE